MSAPDYIWIVQESTHYWKTNWSGPYILAVTPTMQAGIDVITRKLDEYDSDNSIKFHDRGKWVKSAGRADCKGYDDDVSYRWTVTKHPILVCGEQP